MIEFNRNYSFTNDFGDFTINFKTAEHPNPYGNGTFMFTTPISYPKQLTAFDLTESFDIRYNDVHSAEGVHELVMHVLRQRYGVTEADYNDIEEG